MKHVIKFPSGVEIHVPIPEGWKIVKRGEIRLEDMFYIPSFYEGKLKVWETIKFYDVGRLVAYHYAVIRRKETHEDYKKQ